jgi:hypothetical protein
VGEIVDLSFFADRDVLASSRELRRALDCGHLVRIDERSPQAALRSNFLPPVNRSFTTPSSDHPAIRRAVFVDELAEHTNMAYPSYALRSLGTRRYIVLSTHDAKLLKQIVEYETDKSVAMVAANRLGQLENEGASARVG